MKRTLLFLFLALTGSLSAFSQKYLEMMNDPSANFYEVKKEADAYFSAHPKAKGSGYKPYKRWEWFTEQRVYPSGNREVMLQAKQNFIQEKQNFIRQRLMYCTGSIGM